MGPLIANSLFSPPLSSFSIWLYQTDLYSRSQPSPFPLFPIVNLTLSSQGLSNCVKQALHSSSLSLASNSLDAVLHVDGYWLFFLALRLFASLCPSLRSLPARPCQAYGALNANRVREEGEVKGEKRKDCLTASHGITTCRCSCPQTSHFSHSTNHARTLAILARPALSFTPSSTTSCSAAVFPRNYLFLDESTGCRGKGWLFSDWLGYTTRHPVHENYIWSGADGRQRRGEERKGLS